MEGFLAVYFSMRKPTAEDRHGARPPAVRMATFAYIGDGFRARGGRIVAGAGRVFWGSRRRRGRAVMAHSAPRQREERRRTAGAKPSRALLPLSAAAGLPSLLLVGTSHCNAPPARAKRAVRRRESVSGARRRALD